jgi:hypothetical protein
VVQDVANGGTYWYYGFPLYPDVAVRLSQVNTDFGANLVRKGQDILVLIALALDGELSAVIAIQLHDENSVFQSLTVVLGRVILKSEIRNAPFVEQGVSNRVQDFVRGRHRPMHPLVQRVRQSPICQSQFHPQERAYEIETGPGFRLTHPRTRAGAHRESQALEDSKAFPAG